MIKQKNFAFKQPTLVAGETYKSCNFAQAIAGTQIGDGSQTFIDCNLMNCDVQGSTTKGCLTVQKDLCYHLHAEFDDDGNEVSNRLNLPVEPGNCRHVTDTIEVDGVVISYEREDIIL